MNTLDTMALKPNAPPTAMQRAAERWGQARLLRRYTDGSPRVLTVNTTKCLVCGANIVYGRGIQHALGHVRTPPPIPS